MTIRPDIGFIAHFPLNAAIKGEDVDWMLVPVDLNAGRELADALTALRNADGADAFGPPIVGTPSAPLPADVEGHDAEGVDGTHSVTPSVDRQGEHGGRTVTDADAAELEADGVDVDAYVALPPPATDRRTYRDRAKNATVGQVEDVVYLNDHPDEGAEVNPDVVADVGARYAALEPAAKSWVTVAGAGIRLSGTTGKPTQRRLMALTGLLALAEEGWDADDALRAVIEHILGDVAMFANVKPAALVGALGVDEATRFATLCEAVAAGEGSYRHDRANRLHIDGLAAA